MAKVVGRDESAVKRITCRSCAAVLEYTSAEVQRVKHSFDYLGDYEVSDAITCPGCGSNVFVNRRW